MENLVGRKVKCVTNGYCNFDLHQDYIIVNESETMYVVQDNFGKYKDFSKHKFKYYFEILIEEPQFKQGDKVLYTDDLEFWHEGIFLTKYNDSYIIDSDEMLLYAIDIKPYKDEIKICDWVKSELNDCVFKYQFGRLKDDLTKITDEVLISKLNKL